MFKFPYTNFHELNLDWIIGKIKNIETAETTTTEAAATATEAAATATEAATAAAGSAASASGSAATAQDLVDQLDTGIAKEVTDWLEENITPTTPAIDASLTVAGAAADSKAAGDAISRLKSNVFSTAEETGTADYVVLLGVSSELLKNDGTTTSNNNWKTTGFIPVTTGEVYAIERPGATGTYTLYRCTYDSNKNFISYDIISAEAPVREYEATAGVGYVRFSVSNSVYNGGFRFRLKRSVIQNIQESLGNAGRAIEYSTKATRTTDYVALLGVSSALLQNTGEKASNNNWKTTDFIPVVAGAWYVTERPDATDTYTLYRCTYDINKTLIAYNRIDNATSPTRDYLIPDNVAFVRFSVSNSVYENGFRFRLKHDAVSILKHNIMPAITTHAYSGNELNLTMNRTFYASKLFNEYDALIPAGKTAQGFDISNGVIFQMLADDLCRLYDLYTGETIGDITIISGHGNSVVFSKTYYEANDEFPLLYVSDIDGNVYVNRVTREGSELIRTIYFDPVVFGSTPQLAIDGDICYIVGNAGSGSYMTEAIITRCNVSNAPAVIDSFRVTFTEPNIVLQGVKFLNGCLYLASGGYSTAVLSVINVIDVNSKTLISKITDFPEIARIHELEDMAFIPNHATAKYDAVIHVREYGYYKLTF